MRLIDPKKIPKMGESTTLEDAPMYEFAQCLVDYLVENYGVDVPDIVRGKDCIHRSDEDYCPCGRFDYSWEPPEDFYCALGEKNV